MAVISYSHLRHVCRTVPNTSQQMPEEQCSGASDICLTTSRNEARSVAWPIVRKKGVRCARIENKFSRLPCGLEGSFHFLDIGCGNAQAASPYRPRVGALICETTSRGPTC